METFTKKALRVGLLLLAGGATVFAGTTQLEFEQMLDNGGSITFSTTTVATFSSVPVNDLVVTPSGGSSKTYSVTGGAFNLSGDTLTLTGTISGLPGNQTVSGTLETINLNSAPVAATVTNASFSVNTSQDAWSVKSTTLNTNLMNDLGLTGTPTFTSFTDSGSETSAGPPITYNSTSLTDYVSANQSGAPEPVSLLLVSGGLLGVGAFRLRKARSSR